MKNIYFPDEDVTENDLYFVCYMIERTARCLHQRNLYVVTMLGRQGLQRQISIANTSHSSNPSQIEQDWIDEYGMKGGCFDITGVDPELVDEIPTALQMGKVYTRLILQTMLPDEDYVQAIQRVYQSPICNKIDNYNCSAYYEPSYVIARAYINDGF